MRYCVLYFTCLLLLSSYSRAQEKIKSEDGYPDARTPWTQVKVNDSEDKFQFIIVSDRTGSMRPGVFQDAVKKIRLLQPDFVVSIGDLIDGYTRDTELIASQWNEFENMINELNLPFFRVPGNHDISNQVMEQEWIKRYGRTYYYFRYKNVLFLCLNTEDPPPSHISSGQINYVKNVLQNNEDVYHTIILMHRPLWDYGNKAGFEKIEKLLDSRPYTIFSGHHHNYFKSTKNGNQRYVLATTGGGSYLRGAEVGEFDHMVWVTMKGGRPVTVNLKLDGIISDDIVTEDIYPQVQLLRLGEWFQITPIVHSQPEFYTLQGTLIFNNPTDSPLQVSGRIKKVHDLSVDPSHIKCTVPPDTMIQ
ncbi:MAG: metallophosphoesterase, partial [bacterium]